MSQSQQNDNSAFQAYKPLRNHLNKLKLDDSFFVIWSHIQYLQFKNMIPNEIEVIPEYLNADYIQKRRWCSPWELETLTREIIINGSEVGYGKTITQWNYFVGAINKLKDLENKISGFYVNQNNILTELFRIAHRQFLWQTMPNSDEFLTRYYKIFSSPELDKIIEKSIGLSAKALYIIGMLFIGAYQEQPAITLPINVPVRGINKDNIQKFLSCFSSTINDLKTRLKQEQEMNSKFAYSFSSLRAYPIIKMQYRGNDCLVCPLPTLLFWRITNGVYYAICGEKGFDNHFGLSFQNYVGEVIRKSITGNKIKFLQEQQYFVGKNRKDATDWIIYDDNSILFIECKTKRLKLSAKFELDDNNYINEELEKMADFILQTYKAIKDYKDNKYPSLKSDRNKKIYPMILTLEPWYLCGDRLLAELDSILTRKLQKENIDLSYLEQMPYAICTVDEFEKVMQIIPKTGIFNFIHNKVFDKEKRTWGFQSYMNSEFTEDYKNAKFLFQEDYDNISTSFFEK